MALTLVTGECTVKKIGQPNICSIMAVPKLNLSATFSQALVNSWSSDFRISVGVREMVPSGKK